VPCIVNKGTLTCFDTDKIHIYIYIYIRSKLTIDLQVGSRNIFGLCLVHKRATGGVHKRDTWER
jgi:hypothetical protein